MLGMGKGLENGVFRGFGNRAKNIMYVWTNPPSLPFIMGEQEHAVARLAH